MASIRPCNKCGERISIRQMPHQQWVAFNVGTDEPHKCSKKNNKETKTKIKLKKITSLNKEENIVFNQPNFIEDQFEKEQEEIENLKNLNRISSETEIDNDDNNLFKNPLFIAIIVIIFLAIFVYP